jgi:hypothetical protein
MKGIRANTFVLRATKLFYSAPNCIEEGQKHESHTCARTSAHTPDSATNPVAQPQKPRCF